MWLNRARHVPRSFSCFSKRSFSEWLHYDRLNIVVQKLFLSTPPSTLTFPLSHLDHKLSPFSATEEVTYAVILAIPVFEPVTVLSTRLVPANQRADVTAGQLRHRHFRARPSAPAKQFWSLPFPCVRGKTAHYHKEVKKTNISIWIIRGLINHERKEWAYNLHLFKTF